MAPSEASFPRRLRLTRAADFERVFAAPTSTSRDSVFQVLASRNTRSHPRLGLAVSRRHVKSAAERNRIKRTIRESFRLHQHELPNLDIVVTTRRGFHSHTTRELRDLLTLHWRRLTQL